MRLVGTKSPFGDFRSLNQNHCISEMVPDGTKVAIGHYSLTESGIRAFDCSSILWKVLI